MRNPNGYGCVVKLSGNRRKPFCVRVTVGWELGGGTVKQKQKVIGTFATREEANICLANYHQDPFTLPSNITVEEVYNRWSAEKFRTVGAASVRTYKSTWKIISELKDKSFSELRRSHLQTVVDTCGKEYTTLKNVKNLFSQLYKYAMQNDIVDKDYSSTVNIAMYKPSEEQESIHKAFTPEEVSMLWERSFEPYIQIILMLVYGGYRITELLDLKKEDVHLAERYCEIKKSKTKAGKRKVPIARKVLPFYEMWMSKNNGAYLVTNYFGNKMNYQTYKTTYFIKVLAENGIEDHLPHDTRHTCVSMLTSAGVIPSVIKRIVGHASQDITESVYTHHDIQELREAIDKI